jgi:hypothetical protein
MTSRKREYKGAKGIAVSGLKGEALQAPETTGEVQPVDRRRSTSDDDRDDDDDDGDDDDDDDDDEE